MSYRGRRKKEGHALKEAGYRGKSRRLCVEGHTCEWVTEESLEAYTLKDTPVNELQRKNTPVNGLQRKVDYTIKESTLTPPHACLNTVYH